MARPTCSRSRPNRHESVDCGGQINVSLIAGLALFAALFGLLGWAWIAFDEDAFKTAMRPPSIIVDIPPPPEISKVLEEDVADEDEDEESFDEGEDVAEADEDGADSGARPDDESDRTTMSNGGVETAPAPQILLERVEVILAPRPQEGLVAKAPEVLPVVNTIDGRMAWELYARPFELNDPNIPKVAVVIGGLGLSQAATETAIQQLPGAVTLAFAPYAKNLEGWIAQARAAGHEVILELPMESFDYPNDDPGPHTLLTSLESNENLIRLDWLLSRFNGYVGVTSFMGAKFTASTNSLEPVLAELNERGLLYLDSKASRSSVAGYIAAELEMPSLVSNRVIDRAASRVAIDTSLYELERIAKSAGFAVGIGFPFPVTIERVSEWARTLRHKKYALAPLSAIVARSAE